MMWQVVVQTPAPEFPLPPPDSMPAPVFLIVALTVVAGIVMIFYPLMRAIARRIEGGRHQLDPAIHEDLDQLRARVADVDNLNQRVGELEERVDFTERMLAQRAAPDRLPEGR